MLILIFRRATEADVPAIVRLLADDMLGASREKDGCGKPSAISGTPFAQVDADANQFLLVVENGSAIVGLLQLTFIAGLGDDTQYSVF